MIEDKDLDELEKTVKTDKPIINFEKPKKEEIVDKPTETETSAMIKKGVEAAVVHKVQTDENVQKAFLDTADKVVDTNLSTIVNNVEADEKAAMLKNNKDACDLYGIDEKTVPKWVVKCAKKVQDFWYAIWLIVGFFTTVPIVFLGKKIKVVLKKTWVSMLFAVLIYVAIAMIPLWKRWF